jgi:ABC-type multidrug transport system ATPase subunit
LEEGENVITGVHPGLAIEAGDIRKSYRRVPVLRGVDLQVERGSLVAVVGENGSGKSTLLRILARDLEADDGSLLVAGRIGYCPQIPILNDNLGVEDHIVSFAAAYRLASLTRADELVADLDFSAFRNRLVGELSGGTRQKLNLTLALMHDPDVLLLDEPYQGFDWETYLRFWDLVVTLRERGTAIVVISHLVFEEGRFDALYELAGGRLRLRVPRPSGMTHGLG